MGVAVVASAARGVRLLHLQLVFHAGLAAVGVALVASAARGLTGSTCKLRVTMVINAAAAVITFYYPATYMFPVCILAGGLVTLYTNRKIVRLSLCPTSTCALAKSGASKWPFTDVRPTLPEQHGHAIHWCDPT